jgi:hypothetical protein
VPLGGFGPGGGTVTILANTPASLADADLMMQAFFADADAEIGFSATPGVLLEFL